MKALFIVCARQEWSLSQEILVESVEPGDRNGGVTKAMHTKRRKYKCKRCRAFPEQVGSQFLWLESVDYFGTSEYFSGRKKES